MIETRKLVVGAYSLLRRYVAQAHQKEAAEAALLRLNDSARAATQTCGTLQTPQARNHQNAIPISFNFVWSTTRITNTWGCHARKRWKAYAARARQADQLAERAHETTSVPCVPAQPVECGRLPNKWPRVSWRGRDGCWRADISHGVYFLRELLARSYVHGCTDRNYWLVGVATQGSGLRWSNPNRSPLALTFRASRKSISTSRSAAAQSNHSIRAAK